MNEHTKLIYQVFCQEIKI